MTPRITPRAVFFLLRIAANDKLRTSTFILQRRRNGARRSSSTTRCISLTADFATTQLLMMVTMAAGLERSAARSGSQENGSSVLYCTVHTRTCCCLFHVEALEGVGADLIFHSFFFKILNFCAIFSSLGPWLGCCSMASSWLSHIAGSLGLGAQNPAASPRPTLYAAAAAAVEECPLSGHVRMLALHENEA
jgi:hypothetical protein